MRCLTLIMIVLMGVSSAAAERIGNDDGGIETYVQRFTQARDSGERVVVDGRCLSACTLVLALVPREPICVTPNASFGFHAAWSFDSAGGVAVNTGATDSMWKMYSQRIRQRIANGGLGDKMIYLRGWALAALYARTRSRHSIRSWEYGTSLVGVHGPRAVNGASGAAP